LREIGADSSDELRFMNSFNQQFSGDNRWLAFRIGIPQEEVRQKRENNESIMYDLGLIDLETGITDTINNIVSYEFSDDGRFLSMNKYKPEGSNIRGSDVILRNLHEGSNFLLGNVAESSFNDEGSHFAMLLDSHDQTGNGAHIIDLDVMNTTVLDSDDAVYRSLQWNEDGTSLAFLKELTHDDYSDETHRIYAVRGIGQNIEVDVFDPTERNDFPEDMRIVDFRSLQWSDDGKRLLFGIKEWDRKNEKEIDGVDPENESEKDLSEDQEDPDAHLPATNVEVWHWRDDPIQPRQRVMSQSHLRSNFLSVWHLDEDRFVQLIEDYEHSIRLMNQQKYAVLYDPVPYQPRFREEWNDVYVVDVATGERTLVLERHENVSVSPGGNYLLYFINDQWWSYHIPDHHHTNLTENIDTRFNNFTFVSGRENDNPFGTGQWAENDEWVLLYDQYDIYKAAPDGSRIEKVTNGAPHEIRYRQYRMSFDEPALDPQGPVYLTMFGDRSKNRGYARLDRRNNIHTLIYEPRMINRLSKADDTDMYIYLEQTAVDSPDFYLY
jgi:hypothetical protein